MLPAMPPAWKAAPKITSLGTKFGIPRQIQRALPVYFAVVLLVLFLTHADKYGSALNGQDLPLRGRSGKAGHDASYNPADHTALNSQFPRKIWQSWKVDPLEFEERDWMIARTWTSKNQDHRYEVLTDNNDLYYVETHFGLNALNRPDIIFVYRSLTLKIIKADLLRYLVMYVEGGVYADIDVEALRPISSFIPERYNQRDIDMVIGIEIDQPEYAMHPILGKKSQSFCQWTFMCKPRLPVMMRLIDQILQWLHAVSQLQGRPISEIELDFDQVISGTGPSAFTNAILAEMSTREREDVTWDRFHALRESRLVGGVLVLTVEAFAAGQGHSDSGNHDSRTALVKHHYHASGWPMKHARYNHPVYGEVERCNWQRECIELWDANKAAYEALNDDEKAKFLAFKEAADASRMAWESRVEAEKAFFSLSKEDQEKLAAFDNAQAANQLGGVGPEGKVVTADTLGATPPDDIPVPNAAIAAGVPAEPGAAKPVSAEDKAKTHLVSGLSDDQKQVLSTLKDVDSATGFEALRDLATNKDVDVEALKAASKEREKEEEERKKIVKEKERAKTEKIKAEAGDVKEEDAKAEAEKNKKKNFVTNLPPTRKPAAESKSDKSGDGNNNNNNNDGDDDLGKHNERSSKLDSLAAGAHGVSADKSAEIAKTVKEAGEMKSANKPKEGGKEEGAAEVVLEAPRDSKLDAAAADAPKQQQAESANLNQNQNANTGPGKPPKAQFVKDGDKIVVP